ncbi:MAG: hypothetical protein Q9202_003950 [Teloschistes flavicans]
MHTLDTRASLSPPEVLLQSPPVNRHRSAFLHSANATADRAISSAGSGGIMLPQLPREDPVYVSKTTPHSKCHNAECDLSSSRPTDTSNIDHEARPVSPALEQLTIDWTLPSTRHHESARIEAATREFRGLWRRITLQGIRKNLRLVFHRGDHDGDSEASDAGSVRRYKIDVEAESRDDPAEGLRHDGVSTRKRKQYTSMEPAYQASLRHALDSITE